jgi:hypothetical protein
MVKEQLSAPVKRSDSRTRQAAKRVGIIVETPQPHLPTIEQEQADTM